MLQNSKASLHTCEEDFFYTQNQNIILKHNLNSSTNLTWDQLHTLQELLYPDTADIHRNILVAPYLSQNSVLMHNHDYFEILYMVSGSCAHRIEQNYSILAEGDICILPPGISHQILPSEHAKLALIMLSSHTLKRLVSTFSSGQNLLCHFFNDVICRETLDYYLLFHTNNASLIKEAFFHLANEMKQTDEYSDRLALSLFSVFLLNITRTCQNSEISSGKVIQNQDQQILSLIHEKYATITLSQLAETLHYSVPYCSKYLKKNLGCTFSELIQKIRFQEARNLLINSNLPVNQIGKNIGYETPENFFRAFKKAYGVTPSQYRKSHSIFSDSSVD